MSIALPESYKNRMEKMLGTEEYEKYLSSLELSARSALRVNGLKLTATDFEKLSDMKLKKVPWIDNAFYYGDEDIPSKHPYYYAGLYYIQEPSAMTPAFLFDVEPGDRVLDLCAAPGGKSTALAAKLKGKGVLVSNDVSNSRAKALLKNLELFGVKNAVVVSDTTDRLAGRFEGYFDKILVDAPCSGEGMFRKQSSIISNWEQYGCEYYSKLQRQILPDAVKMLRPGGRLLYSTCTFSPLEDENAVMWLLENFPDMKLVGLIPENEKEKYEKLGFDHGRTEWIDDDYEKLPEIKETVRLFPHKIEGEGHFIALFEKKSDESAIYSNTTSVERRFEPKNPKKTSVPDCLLEFLALTKLKYNENDIKIKDGRCYIVPEDLPDLKGLRILREGLLLGEIKKDRFEPSQALAMALKAEEYGNVCNLSSDDPRVRKYLKCESIELPDGLEDGYVLICVDSYPLGFGKLKKGSFKNKYLPGWRMM